MFGWFGNKRGVEEIKEETKKSFDAVKKDISSVSGWIKHLESERKIQKKEIQEIKEVLSTINDEIDGIKNIFSMTNELKPANVFKKSKQLFNKQMAVYNIQTDVQTDVQTPNLNSFSITERAILWVLLNTDMNLSYDDLAAMLGKEKSTVRGQINSIKQKSEIISEKIEKNGKKRIYINENIKEKMLKKSKVRVNDFKKIKNAKKNSLKIKESEE